MKDRGGEHRARMAIAHAFHQVLKRADPARGHDRHTDAVRDGARERDVVALLGTVAIHRAEEDLTGAVRHHLLSESERVDPGRLATAMGEDLPAWRRASR